MKKLVMFLVLFSLMNAVIAGISQTQCNKNEIPKVINPMKDWDIIATNTGNIPTASTFSGDHLVYSFSSHPKNSKNKITINKKTGEIRVVAEKKDNFDIIVTAKNACGSAKNKFNVIIDEEE